MRKRNIAVSLAAATPAVAALISACTPAAPNVTHSNLTMQCTMTPTAAQAASNSGLTDGSAAGTGHCTITGVLHDGGPATDYRTVYGETAFIRRVVTGAKGTITFVITINLGGPGPAGESWKITSGTKAYATLHGRGYEVVDNYMDNPATFVMKGTVSPVRVQ